jgi:hypothetical protein
MSRVKDLRKNPETLRYLSSRVFSKILYKTKFNKKKGSQNLLGTDLLKEKVKKKLLLLTTLKLEQTYNSLIDQSIYPSFNFKKSRGKVIFLLLIKTTCEEFLTQEYGSKVKVNLNTLKRSLYTKKLLEDTEILFQVPFHTLINQKSPVFRSFYYPIYSFASEEFIETLIDHLILEISNCIMYFSIISFSSIDAFRQTLYKAKFLSLRNFERFKNNINWQLRLRVYIQRPIDLYNNRYELSISRTNGVYYKKIYANRSRDMMSLTRLSLFAIVFIEFGDFIIGRLDELFYTISKGLRFTFISVIGQIIGLTWRGIIDGLKK